MLSHPLSEVRKIGQEIKKVSLEAIPTLVKYADRNEYLIQIENEITERSSKVVSNSPSHDDWCVCTDYDPDGEYQIMAALLYRFSDLSYQEAYKHISQLPRQDLINISNSLLGNLGKHDIPVREMEYAQISFDLVIDQGAFFELKRHRMMTQTTKPFSPQLGYAIPKIISDAYLLDNFQTAMEQAERAYQDIYKILPHSAAYILPNAFNRRVLLKMNLRTALHLITLRAAPNAHFAIRRTAKRIAEEIQNKYPLFAPYFKNHTDETWQSLEKNFFTKTS